MIGPARFAFHNVEHEVGDPGNWNCSAWPRLWLYNLHYFGDLVADDSAARADWHRVLVARWIAENPLGTGTGWEPYPTSLRIVNWIKWAMSGNALSAEAVDSLAVQARWLNARLETHLLGNHLWANAKALLFAGVYFAGAEADSWRATGLRLLQREMREQILADGGHFERSPMYHAIVLEDLLDLAQLAALVPMAFPDAEVRLWRAAAVRMHRWLRVMSHPDGGIALFNDAALDVAAGSESLAHYASAVGVALDTMPLADLETLPDSGYVRAQVGSAVLIADVAELGPDYLPGHAHADTLSFELSLDGRRVLVNGGTSTYEAGPERLRQRATATHNTVTVDGQDSSEVWDSFRVARRARPIDARWGHDASGRPWLEAAHDGYRRLPGRVEHRRRWTLASDRLLVEDRLSGRWQEAEASFRFAPGWVVDPLTHRARNPESRISLDWELLGAGSVRVDDSTWHARFGDAAPCKVLRVPFAGTPLITTLSWN